jgi:hypothetical protein
MNRTKKKNKNKKSTALSFATTTFPGQCWTQNEVLRTSYFSNVTAAATGIYTTYLRLNDIYNPLGSLSATQPSAFDQLMAIYTRSRVDEALVRLKLEFGTAAGGQSFVACIYPVTSLAAYAAPATFQAAASNIGAVTCEFCAGGPPGVLTMKVPMRQILGRPFNSNDYGHSGGSPANNVYLGIFIQSNVAVASISTLLVDLLQKTLFCERKAVIDA